MAVRISVETYAAFGEGAFVKAPTKPLTAQSCAPASGEPDIDAFFSTYSLAYFSTFVRETHWASRVLKAAARK